MLQYYYTVRNNKLNNSYLQLLIIVNPKIKKLKNKNKKILISELSLLEIIQFFL